MSFRQQETWHMKLFLTENSELAIYIYNNNNNNNNNNGLLKYTWWHKNYELQCAYISYN